MANENYCNDLKNELNRLLKCKQIQVNVLFITNDLVEGDVLHIQYIDLESSNISQIWTYNLFRTRAIANMIMYDCLNKRKIKENR